MKKPTLKDIAISSLVLNADNIRFNGKVTLDGVKLPNTMNIESMKTIIKDTFAEKGSFVGRLVVEETDDGKYKVLCGNRRTAAAQELFVDPTISVELKNHLAKLPCEVYSDLTDDERRSLVNDQRSQHFRYSEIVALAWKLQANGWNFPQIALELWPNFIPHSGVGIQREKEVNEAKSDSERKTIITRWLKGKLGNEILASAQLGRRVRQAFLLGILKKEGNLPVLYTGDDGKPVYQEPEFNVNQARTLELGKLKAKEIAEWTYENGSPEFNEAIERYRREDNGESAPPIVRPSNADLERQEKDFTRSKAAKAALEYAQGKKPTWFADADDEARRLELVTEKLVLIRDQITNSDVKEFIQLVLSGDPLDPMFEATLQKWC